jgi:hypothetical protein
LLIERGRRIKTLGFGGVTNKSVVGEEYRFFSNQSSFFWGYSTSCIGYMSAINNILHSRQVRIKDDYIFVLAISIFIKAQKESFL